VETVELTTPRLLIRDFLPTDLADVHAMRADPEVAEFMDFAPETLEQSREWLEGVIHHNALRPREAYNLAVVHRAGARVIGWVGTGRSSRYPDDPGEFGVGYMLARPYWGRGLTPEALEAVLVLAFETLGATRVSAWCWADNAASARVMAKAGMQLVRTYDRTEPKSREARPALEYAIQGRPSRVVPGGSAHLDPPARHRHR
jgi:ribosomal-protein-alanine N-acetyltransferase